MLSSFSFSGYKKVTFFLSSLRGGGAERVMLTLINELASSGFEVTLVLLRAEGPYLTDVHTSVVTIDIGTSRALFSLYFMIRYFRKHKPTVVVSALPHINIVTCWAQRLSRIESKIIITEHNTLSSSVKNATTRKGRWLPVFMRLTYPLADTIIAVSKGVADDLSTVLKLPRNQINGIYNPVVSEQLKHNAEKPVDHPWLKSKTIPVVLGVGRLTEAKNFGALIHAFSIVTANIPARLIILGEGSQRSTLEAIVHQLNLVDKVDLPGFAENPYPYMKRSSLFVLSSIWEGLPTVLIEALSCGTKVVSTDCPSGPREILENGKWGTLVPIDDVKELANAMINSIKERSHYSNPQSWEQYTVQNALSRYTKFIVE